MKSLFNWVGGKSRVCKRICSLFPPHTVYVEPYFGAGSVFFHKSPVRVEVLNDLDKDVYNFYSVLRNKELVSELLDLIEFTPYCRDLYKESSSILDKETSPVLKAWAFYVRVTQGYGARLKDNHTWCCGPSVSRAKVVIEQKSRLMEAHHRLMGAYIENKNALEVLKAWDTPDTLFYLDPPYSLSKRTQTRLYCTESPDSHHVDLVDIVRNLKGYVFINGYNTDEYESLGWPKLERNLVSSLATLEFRAEVPPVEQLLVNPRAYSLIPNLRREL